MNKKLIIGVGVAATLMAAYFIFKPKKKEEGMPVSGGTGGSIFKCQFPNIPCPNNPNKCFNPLLFGQGNQCA
jgi:hypothetical protein